MLKKIIGASRIAVLRSEGLHWAKIAEQLDTGEGTVYRTARVVAQDRKWMQENPASRLKSPKVSLCLTLPYTREEVMKILAAIETYIDEMPSNGMDNARRMRALVLLLRYSGIRISDAVNLSTDRMIGNRLFLYTQKTGVPVNAVLPEFVVAALEATPKATETHFFWSGVGNLDSAVRSWQTRLRRLFDLANISGGHAHRFRDTYAVELLLASVPIERVSILLGHQSVRVTEKHYAPWVRSRQEQLEADLESAWKRDPLVLLEARGTPEVHGTVRRPN
jgi:integrase